MVERWEFDDAHREVASPPATTPTPGERSRTRAGAATTPWVWLIAGSPTLQIGFHVAVALLGGVVNWRAIYALAAVSLIANVFLANADVSVLRTRGLTALPSKYWALLAPVYLALRGSRAFNQIGRGTGPFWFFIAQFVAFPILWVVVSLWGGAIGMLGAAS
ncbi:MAG TPA: hypothetical protein VIJ76_06795 [Galbitalea sp.]